MLIHDITTRCHSCARLFEMVIDEHLDRNVWEMPEGEYVTCPHCGHVHGEGFEMALIFECPRCEGCHDPELPCVALSAEAEDRKALGL